MTVASTTHKPNARRGGGGRRLLLCVTLGVLWGLAVAWRLYQLQVERHEHYAKRASRQHEIEVKLDAPRGTIYDARGRELAVSVRVDSVVANPSRIADPEEAAVALARVLDVPRRELEGLLGSERDFVFLARKVEPEVAAAVRALGLEGVGFEEESRRYYPMGQLAANVLGFVGIDNGGLAGLESQYDQEVGGEMVYRRSLRDGRRGRLMVPGALDARAVPGADLHLTLDAALQHVAESELARAVEEWGAEAGTVVLLDAADSAILAMASYPSFDPNRFAESPPAAWRNRAVMDAYEPGSTFKMLTAAAALDTLAVHPEDRFDCELGGVTLAGTFIGDHKRFGVLTFREVIESSSNVGVIKAALRTGTEPFYRVIVDFGFGRRTGVDLPGESAGIVRPLERWKGLSTAYAAFGHGLSITPLQLANAYAALANGGRLHRPYMVRAIDRGEGPREVERPAPQPVRLSPATVQGLVRLLEGVVERGTGKAAAIPGYRVAGKTGTAEKSDSRGYSNTGRLATFVGFVPARAPRLVAVVMLDEPRRSTGGGVVSAPVFSAVVGEALLYLGIPPERDPLVQIARFVRLPTERPGAEQVAVVAAAGGGRP
ncbi:MAG TPA: penicillin-binding protein 2 [Thermoanaerobaculia bacterium]|nr:penicillin-binding protein 2 [Thermoanaerobaculia bacterium]